MPLTITEKEDGMICFTFPFYFFHHLFQNNRFSRIHKYQTNLSGWVWTRIIISNEWLLPTNSRSPLIQSSLCLHSRRLSAHVLPSGISAPLCFWYNWMNSAPWVWAFPLEIHYTLRISSKRTLCVIWESLWNTFALPLTKGHYVFACLYTCILFGFILLFFRKGQIVQDFICSSYILQARINPQCSILK